jgi:peptide/nickel transport system substrate-binding protein
VWDDRTPITCDDVAFTWRAILWTTGSSSTAGYDGAGESPGIRYVDCADPRTVKLVFKAPYADWPDLFGGTSGFILERGAFPDVDPDKPDLKSEMNDSLPFSGGPWVLDSWDPENYSVLKRNDAYWGQKTLIDQVTFVPRTDENTEVASLLSGDVDAIFPQRPSLTFAEQFRTRPDVRAIGGEGSSVLGLWFQFDARPLNEPQVRQAFAYALARDDAGNVLALSDPNGRANHCGPWIPGRGPWCPSEGPFAVDRYDPATARSLLVAAGFDCSPVTGGDPCVRLGEPLRVSITVPADTALDTEALARLVHDARAAGFEIRIRTVGSGELFAEVAPMGDFQAALYRMGPLIDPSVTRLFGCNQIPTQANGFGGANWVRLCNKQADPLRGQIDQDPAPAPRAARVQQLGRLLAEELPMLPLDVPPAAAAWRKDKLAGVDPAAATSPYGFFFGMDQWSIAG